jgi:hypothetical protein
MRELEQIAAYHTSGEGLVALSDKEVAIGGSPDDGKHDEYSKRPYTFLQHGSSGDLSMREGIQTYQELYRVLPSL